MKNQPFNLDTALKGHPVELRGCYKAYVRHEEKHIVTSNPLTGFYFQNDDDIGLPLSWRLDGAIELGRGPSPLDITGMWNEEVIFEHWHLLGLQMKYIAVGASSNTWWAYTREPEINPFGEMLSQTHSLEYSLKILNTSLFPKRDGRALIIKRPNE